MIHRLKTWVSAALLLGAAVFLSAQTPNDTISLPAGTVEGVLPNGLRYLILPNDYPAGRVEYRLVWQVGSVQQDDTQGGGAHFLEHIAFGGSKHFPHRGAVSYLESLGMKYGIDINAFTGHDRTIYMFATPADAGYSKPLQIIRDWMTDLTINPQRVETEKGIILEELRSTFQEDPFYNLKIGKGRFASRMPLGTPDEVSRMTPKVLRDFYRHWYIPRLGAIVVVGDVDPKAVEAEIKSQFSSIKRGKEVDFRRYPLTYSPSRQLMAVTDTLLTNEELEIIIPHPTTVTRTISDARRKALGNIVINAINRRFHDRGIHGEASNAWYLGDSDHLVFKASEHRGHPIDSCVTRISREVNGILKQGFTDKEIRYQVDASARRASRLGQGGNSSTGWCEDFADYIISGDRYITDTKQVEQLQDSIRTITAAEATALFADWMAYADSTMLMAVSTTPMRESQRTFDDIYDWWEHGFHLPARPYEFTEPVVMEQAEVETPAVLAEVHPFAPESIADKRTYPGIGVHEYRLNNGIKLVVKPTIDDGNVLMTMVAPGGYATIPTEDLPVLGGAGGYIDMGGIAKVPEGLGDYMYQHGMALTTTIENDWHGFMGAYDGRREGEFFNLVYEKITDPELPYDDFEEIRQGLLEDVGSESMLTRMLNRAPDRQLMARMDQLMGRSLDYDAGSDSLQRANIMRMNLDSIAAFYKHLYTRPQGSTFIVCGDVNPDSTAQRFAVVFSRLTPLSGPGPRFSTLSLPTDTLTQRFPNENPSQTAFDYLYSGKYEPSLRNSLVLKMIANVLRNHIIAELRERRALVYSPFVDIQYEGRPRGYYFYDVNSSADNAKMPQVHAALREVITDLRENPVSDEELNAIKRSCVIARREALTPEATSMWRTILTGLEKNSEALADFDRYEEIINSITPWEIREAFRRYVDPDKFVLLYMSDQPVSL